MASIIKQIQADIEARIAELAPDGVTVMSRLRGDISNNIAANIAKGKIAVLCFPPAIGGIKSNVASALMASDCRMQIRIVENPLKNNTGTDAYEVVERLLSLNAYKTSAGVFVSVDSVESADPDNIKVVEFVFELKMQINFPRIASPLQGA